MPRFHCAFKPGSVPRPRADEQSYIWDECCHSPQAALLSPRVVMISTALHTGRNLAVASEPLARMSFVALAKKDSRYGLVRPASLFRASQGGFSLSRKTVSVRIPILTDDGCYPLPDSILRWVCPDFPLLAKTNSDCFAQTPTVPALAKKSNGGIMGTVK